MEDYYKGEAGAGATKHVTRVGIHRHKFFVTNLKIIYIDFEDYTYISDSRFTYFFLVFIVLHKCIDFMHSRIFLNSKTI
jgi:hypothetical protein